MDSANHIHKNIPVICLKIHNYTRSMPQSGHYKQYFHAYFFIFISLRWKLKRRQLLEIQFSFEEISLKIILPYENVTKMFFFKRCIV